MADTKDLLKSCEEKMEKTTLFLDESLGRIRAGRANLHILDDVKVESYGTVVPLNQVANVQIQDARTISIRPWDKKAIRDIEKGIMAANVGITPENNGEIIRLNLPQPTEERRRELTKQCNAEGEKSKVQVRNIRRDGIERLKKMIKEGLSEDLEKDAEAELQKIHDKFIKKVDTLIAAKNEEIMTI
ncbi:MAG: ribosome recycling factor [Prevotella sp.]|nr:ribosome recycling factor [Candidatus Equicola faecalis]MDO4818868.1 ribosome recycling factor [Prevotella sp.]